MLKVMAFSYFTSNSNLR